MPLPAFAIPSIIAGVTGAGQVLGGLFGALGNKRPEYEIPESLRQSVALARLKVQDPNAPGYSQAREQLDLTAANALYAAQQSGGAQIGLGEVVGQTEAGARHLQQMNVEDQARDVERYQSSLGELAQAEDVQFQMNEFAPYAQRAQESRDVFGAGLENIMLGAREYGLYKTALGGGGRATTAGGGTAGAGGIGNLGPDELAAILKAMRQNLPI